MNKQISLVRIFRGLCICSVIYYFSKQTILQIWRNYCSFAITCWSSYIQLHWIVSLIPILQGDLRNVPWSWQTFPSTDLHTTIHLCTDSVNESGYGNKGVCRTTQATPRLLIICLDKYIIYSEGIPKHFSKKTYFCDNFHRLKHCTIGKWFNSSSHHLG